MKLEEVIKQNSFPDIGQKAILNLLYSASWLGLQMRQALDPFDISWQQFNMLRILRGQKGVPVSLKLITERMIDKTSNTSRLVEKLVKKDFIERVYCPKDRRQLEITLTKSGTSLVKEASQKMDQSMSHILNHMDQDKLQMLNELLEDLRLTETQIVNH